MLVSNCGSQKIGASGGGVRGSTGKSQPPLIADFLRQQLGINVSAAERLEIMIVIVVAAQPLPGEVGCGEIVEVIVMRRYAPLGCVWRHCVPPPRFIELQRERDFPERLIAGSLYGGNGRRRGGIAASAPLAFADEFPIAAFGHPARAGQMGIVNEAAALGVEVGIEAEQDLHGFAPIGAVARGVEQAQIQRHVLPIIGREPLTGRRRIQKL